MAFHVLFSNYSPLRLLGEFVRCFLCFQVVVS